ncbi:hypothetical protein EDD22DRAFT_964480 [Suillus occidentalis]|nr:hypothetical protein EDD22DRAFT_964480 [Suillus occidentalis]
MFAANRDTGDDKKEGFADVLYPHHRIKITELLQAGKHTSTAGVQEETHMVTSPSKPTEGDVAKIPQGPVQTLFLHTHVISIVQVDNLATQPYNEDDQRIRVFMSEIVPSSRTSPSLTLFRDRITNFSINQVASNDFNAPNKLTGFAAAVSSGEKELINAQLQSKISHDFHSKIAKRRREYHLMEHLKRELDMGLGGKDKLVEKFKERAALLKIPAVV